MKLRRSTAAWCAAVAAARLALPAGAGEIPGLPPPTLPDIPRQAQLTIGNDSIGSRNDGIFDDFRTQQIIVDADLGERWIVAVDHSILTFESPGFANDRGRLDQLSGSVGYRLLRPAAGSRGLELIAGLGLRSYNDFGGGEIQNGFHRLVDDRIVDLPYVATRRTDLTAWARAQQAGDLPWATAREMFGENWRVGYWLHGTALATSDGQWDSAAAGHLTLRRSWFNAWLGLRADWRRGYDRDPVQIATADNEETVYAVLGLRFGPLLIETQQSGESDKGFGRVALIADFQPSSRTRAPPRAFSLTPAVTAPSVYALLQARSEFCGWLRCTPDQRWRLVGEARFGNPSIGNATDRYTRTLQLGGGLELERSVAALPDWLSIYGWAGGGWRREEVRGENALSGNSSAAVDRFVALGELGLRATTIAASERWSLRVQLGLTGWLPFGSETVAFAGGTEKLQQPGLALLLGGVFEYRP